MVLLGELQIQGRYSAYVWFRPAAGGLATFLPRPPILPSQKQRIPLKCGPLLMVCLHAMQRGVKPALRRLESGILKGTRFVIKRLNGVVNDSILKRARIYFLRVPAMFSGPRRGCIADIPLQDTLPGKTWV